MNLEVPMKKRLQRCCILSSCVLMLMSLCLTAAVCSAAHAEEVGYSTPCIADGSGGNVSSFPFTEGEKTLLCRFVSEECRDQPYACRVAAAAVVLNRIKQAGFPNTVEKVIFTNCGFACVKNYTIGSNISKEDIDLSMQAVRQAINGEDPTGGALYFAKEGEASITSISFRAGDMVFGW